MSSSKHCDNRRTQRLQDDYVASIIPNNLVDLHLTIFTKLSDTRTEQKDRFFVNKIENTLKSTHKYNTKHFLTTICNQMVPKACSKNLFVN